MPLLVAVFLEVRSGRFDNHMDILLTPSAVLNPSNPSCEAPQSLSCCSGDQVSTRDEDHQTKTTCLFMDGHVDTDWSHQPPMFANYTYTIDQHHNLYQ